MVMQRVSALAPLEWPTLLRGREPIDAQEQPLKYLPRHQANVFDPASGKPPAGSRSADYSAASFSFTGVSS